MPKHFCAMTSLYHTVFPMPIILKYVFVNCYNMRAVSCILCIIFFCNFPAISRAQLQQFFHFLPGFSAKTKDRFWCPSVNVDVFNTTHLNLLCLYNSLYYRTSIDELLGFCFYCSLFLFSGPCVRLSWPSRQLLSTR